jgi:ABC-type uncharacterized transport system permease subunit
MFQFFLCQSLYPFSDECYRVLIKCVHHELIVRQLLQTFHVQIGSNTYLLFHVKYATHIYYTDNFHVHIPVSIINYALFCIKCILDT